MPQPGMAQQPLPTDSQTQSPAGYSRHDQTPATVQELVARKVCRICHEVKSLADYHRNKVNADGHNSMCKTCAAEYDKEKRRRRQRVHEPTLTEKECPHCKKVKPSEGFYRYSLSQDGLYNICKLCHADQAKARQEAKAGMCPPPEKVSLHCLCCHTCYMLHSSHRQPSDMVVSLKHSQYFSVCLLWLCVCVCVCVRARMVDLHAAMSILPAYRQELRQTQVQQTQSVCVQLAAYPSSGHHFHCMLLCLCRCAAPAG